MSPDALAKVQAQLCELSELALQIEGLDDFIEHIADAPVADASDLRVLAVATAALQRVIVEQVERHGNEADVL